MGEIWTKLVEYGWNIGRIWVKYGENKGRIFVGNMCTIWVEYISEIRVAYGIWIMS